MNLENYLNKLLRICTARAHDPAVPGRNPKIAAKFKNGALRASALLEFHRAV
jgi:hypothetical protein